MTKAQRNNNWPFQILDGEAVIVVPATRDVHRLDPVATFLWEELARETDIARLAERVAQEFEITPERAAVDVRDFLKELEERHLVTLS